MRGARKRVEGVARLLAAATCVVTLVAAPAARSAGASSQPRTRAAPGTQLWDAREAGSNHAFDQSAGFALSPDGMTVFVAGTSDGAFLLVSRDVRTGAKQWAVRTADPSGLQVFAESVATSPDGARVFVTGDVERSVDTRDSLTVAYRAGDGLVLWSAIEPAGDRREAIPIRIVASPDGARVFVTGSRTGTHGIDDFWDYFTVAYDAANGAREWAATYDGGAHGGDTAQSIGVGDEGSLVFVTGTSQGAVTDRDFATVAYRADDGAPQWVERFDAGADDFAVDLAVDPNGRGVFVAGFGRRSLAEPHAFLVAAYTNAGVRRWVGRFADGGDDMAAAVATGDGSRVFVAGRGSGDFTTAAFDAAGGRLLWSARYDGGHGFDAANAIATSPDGAHVVVTGISNDGPIACFGDVKSASYATVEYGAATGTRAWVARYSGRRDDPDEALSAVVNPDSTTALVTGNSDSGCTGSDVGTVAYQT
jgi:predicted dehydrogenase